MPIDTWKAGRKIIDFAGDHEWDMVVAGFASFRFEKGGAELRMNDRCAVLVVSGFMTDIVHSLESKFDDAGVEHPPSLFDVMTFYVSEADRRLELLRSNLKIE